MGRCPAHGRPPARSGRRRTRLPAAPVDRAAEVLSSSCLPASARHPARSPSSVMARQARSAPGAAGLPQELVALGLELDDQGRVGRLSDDALELRAEVAHEADALEDHIVDQPAALAPAQPGLQHRLVALARGQARAHLGALAVDALPHVADAQPALLVELGDVRRLEQVGEELDELLALGGGAGLPVTAERLLRRLGPTAEPDGTGRAQARTP